MSNAPHHRTWKISDAGRRGGNTTPYHSLSKLRGAGSDWSDFREPTEDNCVRCGLTGSHECLPGIGFVASSRPGAE